MICGNLYAKMCQGVKFRKYLGTFVELFEENTTS